MVNKKINTKEPVSKRESKEPEEDSAGEEGLLDPSIIEDTFSEEFGEYNDVDNF